VLVRRCLVLLAGSLAALSCTGDDGATSTTSAAAPSSTTPEGTAAEPSTSSLAPDTTVEVRPDAPVVRIMTLGDSLTAGGDPNAPSSSPQSYRGYLAASLASFAGEDLDLEFVGSLTEPVAIGAPGPLAHEGHGGFSIGPDESTLCTNCGPANLDAGLDAWISSAAPDAVVVLAGVNDLLPQATPAPTGFVRPVDPSEAPGKLEALVDRLAELAPDAMIFVASYPPIPFLVGVDTFVALNDAARELGEADPDDAVVYVPINEELATSFTPESLSDDIHPNADGALLIADVMADAMEPWLVSLTE
jgi:lysophospholipase L1-like esterase